MASYGYLQMFIPYDCLYLLCRALRPRIIVETGVERGSSTFMILECLNRNGHGILHSLEIESSVQLGSKRVLLGLAAFDDGVLLDRTGKLRSPINDYWELNISDAYTYLKEKSDEWSDKLDIFIHGSAHDYANPRSELLIAKDFTKKDGIIVVDRPDYNDWKAIDEVLTLNEYERFVMRERSSSSPLKFAVTKKK